MAAGQGFYECGHMFPLIVSLVALILSIGNWANLKSYRYHLHYLVCLAAFFLASLIYAISAVLNAPLLHDVASLAELVSVAAIVLAVRSDYLRRRQNV